MTLRTIVKTAFGARGVRGTGPPELLVQLIVPVPPTIGVTQVQPATSLIETNVVLAGVVTVSVELRLIFGHGLVTVRL